MRPVALRPWLRPWPSPWRLRSWDSTVVSNGSTSVVAHAYDAAGNTKASTTVVVNVANAVVAETTPPQVVITSPGNGCAASGNVRISVNATDDNGLAGLVQSLYPDGTRVASSTGGNLSYSWNTRKSAKGPHTVRAVAQDAAGNRSTASLQVTN